MQPQMPSTTTESAVLDALAEEYDRQTASLEVAFHALRELGDTNVIVPPAFLEELADACVPVARTTRPQTMNFVRC